jgi:hypothetical protein
VRGDRLLRGLRLVQRILDQLPVALEALAVGLGCVPGPLVLVDDLAGMLGQILLALVVLGEHEGQVGVVVVVLERELLVVVLLGQVDLARLLVGGAADRQDVIHGATLADCQTSR